MAVLNDKLSMLSAVSAPYICCGNSVGRKWKWLQHLVKKLLKREFCMAKCKYGSIM